jgi:hypothetical protein
VEGAQNARKKHMMAATAGLLRDINKPPDYPSIANWPGWVFLWYYIYA